MPLTGVSRYDATEGAFLPTKGLADGVCPRCDSTVVTREEGVLGGPSGIWSVKDVEVNIFICGRCGLMEFFYRGKSLWK